MDSCQICKRRFDHTANVVKLTEKGCHGINTASEKRNDSLKVEAGQSVHVECRKTYCNPNYIKRDNNNQQEKDKLPLTPLRSKTDKFLHKENCLYCGQSVFSKGRKRKCDVWPVRTLEPTILNICLQRNDSWSDTVRARIEQVNDLPAADAIYHQTCSSNFRTGKDIPEEFQVQPSNDKKRKIGRPEDKEASDAFLQVMTYLKDNDDEQVTIKQLQDKMVSICGDKAYSSIYLKQKIVNHFGEDVIITEINGKENVVTLRRTATSILHDFYRQDKSENTENEKAKLIRTAAKLIKSDIKSKEVDRTVYPNSLDIASGEANKNFLPDSLYLLLRELFSERDADTKISAIGQAMMQATRPRVFIAPLQFALGVQLHHLTSSKYIVELLNSFGFCVSYTEVQMFESSAAVSENGDLNNNNMSTENFIQYVADNVDHNLCTLDGNGTFHGMGMIACVTPGKFGTTPVKRQTVSVDELLTSGKIEIAYYRPDVNQRLSLELEELVEWKAIDCSAKLTLLAQITWPLRSPDPEWSGFMQLVRKGEYPGKSSVVFLPMIDMAPGDMSCIYTTLRYIGQHANRYNQSAIVTFDQPLYWKAMTVITKESNTSPLKTILVRLGGFHCTMSFLGCIGQLMSGSGLNELLETIYASNTIPHMISGKAVSRAVRGHLLTSNALNVLLMRQCFRDRYDEVEVETPTYTNRLDDEFITSVETENGQNASATNDDIEVQHDDDEAQYNDADREVQRDDMATLKDTVVEHGDKEIPSSEASTHEYTQWLKEKSTTKVINTKVRREIIVDTEKNQDNSGDDSLDITMQENPDNPFINPEVHATVVDVVTSQSLTTVSNVNHTLTAHQNETSIPFQMNDLVRYYKDLVSGNISAETVLKNDILKNVEIELCKLKQDLKRYPTASLWIQYLEMVDILRLFIASERTGQWELGLQAMQKMLPYFAAAGHNLYLKSVYLYLQTMQHLNEVHPNVHKAFLEGHHVVRRSDRYWAGLSTDLIIEQVLMRSVKSAGGMTRGKGMTESQRTQWLLSMPSCIDINNAMQAFCGKEFHTSPQHKEV